MAHEDNPIILGGAGLWDDLPDEGLPVKCHGHCRTVYPGHLAYMVVDGLCLTCRQQEVRRDATV